MKAREALFEVLVDLVRTVQAFGMYPETHHRVQEPLARLHRNVRTEAKRLQVLTIGFLGDQVVIDQFPFLNDTTGFARLSARMATRGIEKVIIREGITFQELKRFVSFVAGAGVDGGNGADEPWQYIHFGRISGKAKDPKLDLMLPQVPESDVTLPQVLAGASDVLKGMLHSLGGGEGGANEVEEGKNIVAAVMKGLREEEFLIDRMIRLQSHDDYTVTHSLNVCVMVVAQATRLRLPEPAIHDAGLAALLHDIGKELISQEILNKPGKLQPDEFAKISMHPTLGASHLRKISLGTELPLIVAYEHHVRYDRSGYPKSRFQDKLHPASLMTQIADVYDALRTYRPYRPSLDQETTLGILRKGRGTEFEPVLFDNFIGMIS